MTSYVWAEDHARYVIRCSAGGVEWEAVKRYRDFQGLARVTSGGTVPPFPHVRRGFRQFETAMLERRRQRLDAWLKCCAATAPGSTMDAFLERPPPTSEPSAAVRRVLEGAPARSARSRAGAESEGRPEGRPEVAAARVPRYEAAVSSPAAAALWLCLCGATMTLGVASGLTCGLCALLGSYAYGFLAVPDESRDAGGAPASASAPDSAPQAAIASEVSVVATTRSPEVAALRRWCADECLGGRPLPRALDDDGYLSSLLSRGDRDDAWARQKLQGCVDYRRQATRSKASSGPLADPRLADAYLARRGVDLRRREEPLLTAERLASAGRALRDGGLYVLGRDADGRPVVWARSGKIDVRRVDAAGEEAWIDAIATLFELCALASHSCATPQFAYVEDAAMDLRKISLSKGWRILQGGLKALTKAFPERGSVFVVCGTGRLNRLLFALARPIMPAALKTRIELLPAGAPATRRVAEVLGDASKVPDFFGGPCVHHLPRTPQGDLDLVQALDDLLRDDPPTVPRGVAPDPTGS